MLIKHNLKNRLQNVETTSTRGIHKKIVIEISDSDEEVNLTADDDYRPEETKSRIIDRAADAQTVV